MDRYDQGQRVIVYPQRNIGTVIIVIAVIVLAIVLIYLIIRFRARTTSTVGGTTGLDCVNDIDCVGTQVCDTSVGKCVECNLDGDCPFEKPLCNNTTKKCVNCVNSGDCPSNKPICSGVTNRCIQCETNANCGGATPLCNPSTNLCVGCVTAGDCPISSPLCNPANNQCVQCVTNAQCTFPATCVGGQCCNTTAPTIVSVVGSIPAGQTPRFTGSYTATQPLIGLSVVYEVADSTGFLLFTSAPAPANGLISIVQPASNSSPTYYSGYQYLIRVRLLAPCGATAFSMPSAVVMTYPSASYVQPVIVNASANTGSFTIRTNPPGTLFDLLTFTGRVYISTTSLLDPNRTTDPGAVVGSVDGPNLKFIGTWPFAVSVGQTYYLRISERTTEPNLYVLSTQIAVVIA